MTRTLIGVSFTYSNLVKRGGNEIRKVVGWVITISVFALVMVPLAFKSIGVQFSLVVSNSMYPVVETGAIVILHDTEDINVGDIVTYKDTGGRRILHRIVNQTTLLSGTNEYWVLKGDNNKYEDVSKPNKNDVNNKVRVICNFIAPINRFLAGNATQETMEITLKFRWLLISLVVLILGLWLIFTESRGSVPVPESEEITNKGGLLIERGNNK